MIDIPISISFDLFFKVKYKIVENIKYNKNIKQDYMIQMKYLFNSNVSIDLIGHHQANK